MNHRGKNEDIDSKIADFMADIDEIVQGKKSHQNQNQNHQTDAIEWKECFDENSQSIYYWNTKTNECSWALPPSTTKSQNHYDEKSLPSQSSSVNKRSQPNNDHTSPKKLKKPSLIAEYASSSSSSEEDDEDLDEEENVDHIDELLNEVLEKKENIKKKATPVDPFPTFEADCHRAIARLVELGDRTPEIFSLRIQLETRLEDCRASQLPKIYAMNKLNEALIRIEEFEKTPVISTSLPVNPDPIKIPLKANEMALLLSLPPPPPPPSPPPPSSSTTTTTSTVVDSSMQQFYAELNAEETEFSSHIASEIEKPSTIHHRHHKDKKTKPLKNLPTELIQKWTHARQELRGFEEMNES